MRPVVVPVGEHGQLLVAAFYEEEGKGGVDAVAVYAEMASQFVVPGDFGGGI